MVKTLLPAHKTAVQKALDMLSGERFEALDISVISILPLTCPSEILPHLAQSLDVDISGLDEGKARELLQDAFQIHLYAGTPYALKRALAITFEDAGAEEWMEYGGEPYHFRVFAKLTGNAAEDLVNRLVKTASRYKNARSILESVILSLDIKGDIRLALGAEKADEITINASVPDGVEIMGMINYGIAPYNVKQTEISPKSAPVNEVNITVFAACAVINESQVSIAWGA
ncbi:MAG: phage tail protein [Campylobacteraceae bacterium]|jgi:phage tail P2-like protein|nr:phage tail protein [Campylobacteraceae bacterium]